MKRENIEITVEDGVLKVYGRLDFSNYAGLQPIYTEYNVGHYARSFQLSGKIDQGKISAKIEDGVLYLTLPKSQEGKPRTIAIS